LPEVRFSPHPPEITKIFRKRSKDSGLWVCRNPHDARAIRNGVDQIAAGRLLGYPQCCIDAQQRDHASFEDALVRGWVGEFGNDPEKIAQAWFEDREVRIELEPPDRAPRTIALFPFVQHVACESCLTAEETPTAVVNSEYRDLAADVDPTLHNYLVRLGKQVEEQSAHER